jgi:hypothetical protein
MHLAAYVCACREPASLPTGVKELLILVANSCTLPPEAIRRYHMAHGAYAWLTGRDALCWQGGSLEEGCTVSAGVPPGPIVR